MENIVFVLFFVFVLPFFIVIVVYYIGNTQSRQPIYKPTPYHKKKYSEVQTSPLTKEDFYLKQIAELPNVNYGKKRLLNYSEEKVFWEIHNTLKSRLQNKKLYCHPQVSLGEILSYNDENAGELINSKRVDFCICDKSFYPVAVVEFNGSGHYSNYSNQRDEIKRLACEKAGIKYISVSDLSEITKKVIETLDDSENI